MKNLKSEKGAITLIALVSVMFLISFLISSYIIVANKVKTQKEVLEQTKKIYDNSQKIEEIYNSYFSNDGTIPIYTVEQMLLIGENKQICIKGKIYNFTNESTYILKNDLQFSAVEIGLTTDWIAIGSDESTFNGRFEGDGHTITVTNLDGTTRVYSEENNYGAISNKWKVAQIKPEGWSEKVTAMTDGQETIPLPNGFTISSIEGEDVVESGLVISDKNENEFVWIKVETPIIDISDKIESIDGITSNYGKSPNWEEVKKALQEKIILTNEIYPMAAKIGGEHYIGISYLFDSNGDISNLAILNGGTSYMEPRAVTGQYEYKKGTTYDADYNNLVLALSDEEKLEINEDSTTEECATYFYNILQNDFDEMVRSVIKYKGFYIGRYETGGLNSQIVVSKAGEKGNSLKGINWYEIYIKQKEFSKSIETESIGSTMIWGCQYDQVMIFVNGKKDGNNVTYNVGTAGQRMSGNSQTETGNLKVDKVANIFDLEGNNYEWTAEANNQTSRTARGGNYNINKPASYRSVSTNIPTAKSVGSRISIYAQ